MDTEINQMIQSIEDSTARARRDFGSLNETQLNWKPAPEKWSVGECLEHLVVTNKQYFPALERITKGEHKNSFWQSFSPLSRAWGKILLKTVSPENKKKTKTARVFTPANSSVSKNIIDDFAKCNRQVISFMQNLGAADLKKTRIYSPVLAFITYSLGDSLKIITFHERRHLNQAQKVTETEGFPKT